MMLMWYASHWSRTLTILTNELEGIMPIEKRPMNPDVKAKWLAALEVKKQGTKALRPTPDTFCCLGVLCDIYSQEFGIKWEEVDEWESGLFMGEEGTLPTAVKQWAGLPDINPNVTIVKRIFNEDGDQIGEEELHPTLAELNDDGATFQEISKIIEEQF